MIQDMNAARGASLLIEDPDAKLTKIAALGENWDSYGAVPPDAQSVISARLALRLANSDRTLPQAVVPSAEGGVSLCWDMGAKHAYIEFGNDGTAVVATYEGDGEPYIREFHPDIPSITDGLQTVCNFMRA
jgi:hypothetical protein